MYTSFFNLHRKPFELVPDPEFIFLSRSHKKALTYLDYGIRERAGFILLTGDVGSGKTTLIRDLLKKRYEHVTLAKVFNTRVTSEQLLAMINDDFGLEVAGKDKVVLMRDLNDFLLEQYAGGFHPILIIDEAQNLGPELLEEIRMISNLENDTSKLLQIMLVGQPELRETLALPQLMQLRQRISINCHLKALSRPELLDYIVHRMTVAGNGEALEFTPETLDLVYHYSRGVPRLINIMCDFLMLSAFAEELHVVSAEMARDVIGDLDFENHFWGNAPASLPADGPVPGAPAGPDPILQQIADRLNQMEQDAQRVPAALQAMSEALTELKSEFSGRLEQTEEQMAELRDTVDGMTDAVAEGAAATKAQVHPAQGGFARRFWDGMSKR